MERIPEHPRSWILIEELTCCRRWIEEILEEDRDLLQMLVDAWIWEALARKCEGAGHRFARRGL